MTFAANTITSPNNYFEDFEVGQVIAHARGKTMTEMDNVLLTNVVMDTADGRFNEDRMKTAVGGIAGFNTRIVFGGINLSLVIGLGAQDTGERVLHEIGMDKKLGSSVRSRQATTWPRGYSSSSSTGSINMTP